MKIKINKMYNIYMIIIYMVYTRERNVRCNSERD